VIITEGDDGKTYTRAKREPRPSVRYAAWEFKGMAGKMLTHVQSEMETLVRAPFTAIDADRAKGIRYALAKITDAAMTLMARLDAGEFGQPEDEGGDDE
jgi:hypothetical protein